MRQNHFSIKPVSEADWPVFKKLVDEIWPVTYQNILSSEQIKYMMEMMYSLTSLKKQMEEGSCFYIMYSAEIPVGYLALSTHYEDKNLNVEGSLTKVDKIYVLPKTQGTGAGRYLMDFAFAEAKKAGDFGVMLNVNRDNKAIGFYEHYGFENAYSGDFDIGSGYLMEDYIMYFPFKK